MHLCSQSLPAGAPRDGKGPRGGGRAGGSARCVSPGRRQRAASVLSPVQLGIASVCRQDDLRRSAKQEEVARSMSRTWHGHRRCVRRPPDRHHDAARTGAPGREKAPLRAGIARPKRAHIGRGCFDDYVYRRDTAKAPGAVGGYSSRARLAAHLALKPASRPPKSRTRDILESSSDSMRS